MISFLRAQDCSNTSIGLIPLTDLGVGHYQGFEGGLYPHGSNQPPSIHLAAGFALAQQIVPLDSAGNPDPVDGKYVLLSIGMSNATQEFEEFVTMADADADRNSRLVVVDGAQGGWSAEKLVDPAASFWTTVENQRLPARGVTPQHVQIVWLKDANARPTLPFPQDAEKLQNDFLKIAQIIKRKYPSTKLIYLSSRTYAGYATTQLSPEPFAYQSGFAVKWLIEQQLSGAPALNYDPQKGPVEAPWLAWGPYLWTDGLGPDGVEGGTPGRSDGLEWTCSTEDLDGDGFPDGDVNRDGTHPAISGRIKVANLLMDFFRSDSTAQMWYLNSGTTTSVDVTDHPGPDRFGLQQNYPNPFNPTTTIRFSLSRKEHVKLIVFDTLGREVKVLLDGELPFGEHSMVFDTQGLNSGIYFYRLTAGPFTQTRKAILVK